MRPADRARRDWHMRFPRARHSFLERGWSGAACRRRLRHRGQRTHTHFPARYRCSRTRTSNSLSLARGQQRARRSNPERAHAPNTRHVTILGYHTAGRSASTARDATLPGRRLHPHQNRYASEGCAAPRGLAAPGALTLFPARVFTVSRYHLHGQGAVARGRPGEREAISVFNVKT